MCRTWWDQRCRYTLLLDAEGVPAAEIAQTLGVAVDQVQRILHPRPPRRFHTFLEGGTNAAGECMFVGDAEPVYRTLVEESIVTMLRIEYEWAALAAEVEKPHLAPCLRALAEHYRKQRDRIHEQDEWATFWSNRYFHKHLEDFTVPFWSCAQTDARIAVGIEADRQQDLFHLWMEACA